MYKEDYIVLLILPDLMILELDIPQKLEQGKNIIVLELIFLKGFPNVMKKH